MPAVPNWLAGSVTVAFLVGFGIFLYPWLLRRRFGAAVVALASVVLAMLYFYFDAGRSDAAVSAAFALLWAAAPVITGVIVYRLQRR
jgi:Ca2+/Na+ antiporter